MEHLDKLLKLVESEIEAVAKNGKFRSKDEIEAVYKLTDIAKDVYCIWKYEDEYGEEDEMSYAGGPYMGGMQGGDRDGGRGMNRGGYYDGGSYRGRRGNVRRDSMGRYSRSNGYSMDGKDDYIENLREMMESAPDEETRQSIRRMIQKMEQA